MSLTAEKSLQSKPDSQRESFSGELKRAQNEEGICCRTHIGGQALIEGIMMRGKYNWAVAIRQPDGTIHLEEHDLASGKDKNSWMYKPVVRGCTALVESLALGYKALDISAQYAYDFEEEERAEQERKLDKEVQKAQKKAEKRGENFDPVVFRESLVAVRAVEAEAAEEAAEATEVEVAADKAAQADAAAQADQMAALDSLESAESLPMAQDQAAQTTETSEKKEERGGGLTAAESTFALILGLVLGIALFIIVPAVLTNLLVGNYGDKGTFLWNLVDGILRIAVFIFYIWLIGRMKDIKRMFSYHGAEHKTIHCFEHGLELTPENAQTFPTLHVRCGTAFIIMTLIIAILVFTIVPVNLLISWWGITNGVLRLIVVILARLVLLPVVAGLAYEVTVKWAGARPENKAVRVVLWPGMQMQRLTTNAPDEGALECAIAAMSLVLAREQREQQARAQQDWSARG